MTALKHKIDFAAILVVNHANPNGDPLDSNRPRKLDDGRGEISDVCIKRKLRNRLLQAGHGIFVQSDDSRTDAYRSLRARAEGEIPAEAWKDEVLFRDLACAKWLDVRAFGQLFAYKGAGKKKRGDEADDSKGDSVSIGIRGPLSIHPAFSINRIAISSIQITKSVNSEGDGFKRASDTMGMKHRVDHGLYVLYGCINPQLAEKTGFSEEDAEAVKSALLNLFRNDASSARPEGSMEVHKLYWWQHNSAIGQYASAKVHRTLQVRPREMLDAPSSIEDYEITLSELPGLVPEVIEGE